MALTIGLAVLLGVLTVVLVGSMSTLWFWAITEVQQFSTSDWATARRRRRTWITLMIAAGPFGCLAYVAIARTSLHVAAGNLPAA
jgi:hypothetical protein